MSQRKGMEARNSGLNKRRDISKPLLT